jgi:hypothetical protein
MRFDMSAPNKSIMILCIFLMAMFYESSPMKNGGIGIQQSMELAADTLQNERFSIYDDSWAIIIGIDKYYHARPLYYAVKDAKEIGDLMMRKCGFSEDNIKILTNDKATLKGIKRLFEEICAVTKPNDQLVVFFAGHGATLTDSRGGEHGYLVPVNGKTDSLYSTCLAMSDLRLIAERIEAKHIIFLVDACYSGLAAVRRAAIDRTVPGYVKKVTKAPARQIITAGGQGERVEERPEWGHSAFTKKLIDAFDLELADSNDDHIIEATELALYISREVSRITEHHQTPQFESLTYDEGEFVFLMSQEPTERTIKPESDMEDDVVYIDNFDNYPLGEFPPDWYLIKDGNNDIHDGQGLEYQFVDDTQYVSSPFSFKLEGKKNWSATTSHSLPQMGKEVTVAVDLLITEVDKPEFGDNVAYVALGTYQSPRGVQVRFGPSHTGSRAYTYAGPYDHSSGHQYKQGEWIHLVISANYDKSLFSAWIDDDLLEMNTSFTPGSSYGDIRLSAGNSCHTKVWFDNIEIHPHYLLFSDDFDAYLAGEFPVDWMLMSPGCGENFQFIDNTQCVSAPHSLKLEAERSEKASVIYPLELDSMNVTLELDIRTTELNEPDPADDIAYVYIGDGKRGENIGVRFGSSLKGQQIYIPTGSRSRGPGLSYNQGEWIHLQINADFEAGQYEVIVNGELMESAIPMTLSSSEYLEIGLTAETGCHSRVWFDNIQLYPF